MVESIRMPIATTDFAPVRAAHQGQRRAGGLHLPARRPAEPRASSRPTTRTACAKAGIQFLGTAETDEFDLQKFGDAALGLTTAFHYSAAHDSPANKKFVAALKKRDPNAVANYASVGAWDGMYVIHKMIEATGGKRDGAKAIAAARDAAVGEPARPGAHRPEDAPHRAERLPAQGREGRAAQLVNKEVQSFGPQIDYGLDK